MNRSAPFSVTFAESIKMAGLRIEAVKCALKMRKGIFHFGLIIVQSTKAYDKGL